jgi:hypothetical protein
MEGKRLSLSAEEKDKNLSLSASTLITLLVVVCIITFTLAQLTRSVDLPHAVGFAVLALFCSLGAFGVLFVLGVGALVLTYFFACGGNRLVQDVREVLARPSQVKAEAK